MAMIHLSSFILGTKKKANQMLTKTLLTRYFPEVWFPLENWLSHSKDRNVLDMGCGVGFMAEALAKTGWAVTCVDPALPSLLAAQERFSGGKLLGQFHQSELESLPFSDECFSAAISINMLEFAKNPTLALKELRRVLIPGGRAVVSTFNRRSPWGVESVAACIRKDDHRRKTNFLSRDQFIHMLNDAEFYIEQVKDRARYLPIKSNHKFKLPFAGSFIAFVAKETPDSKRGTIHSTQDFEGFDS
jgi:ubiquinone/menaquinone biosynthesis C-methylase UbiE